MATPPQRLVASLLGSEDVPLRIAVEDVGAPGSPAHARGTGASVSRRAVVRHNAAVRTGGTSARVGIAGTSFAAVRSTTPSEKRVARTAAGQRVDPADRRRSQQVKVVPPALAVEDKPSDGSRSDKGSTETDGTSVSGAELDSSDDPDKVAYIWPRRTGQAEALSSSPAAPVYIPSIACTTGDAVLKVCVAHAVLALGEYKVWSGAGENVPNEESERSHVVAPSVLVVGRRPPRSVRPLIAMTQGAWVASESWLLESIGG